MNKFQQLRINRKARHQCTRCGKPLPDEWTKTNCQPCNELATKATIKRRQQAKEAKQ